MTWQDVRHHYEEPDDPDPPRPTVPENPTPGQRYMALSYYRR